MSHFRAKGFTFVPALAAAYALAAFSILTTPACVNVPVRVPAQGRGVYGKPLDLDFTFLKSGSTQREEVTKKLAAIDAGVKEGDFFWGRWDSSKWRTTAVLNPYEGERIWRVQNHPI